VTTDPLHEILVWLDANASHGAVITASATVSVFFATRLIDMVAGWASHQTARRRTIIGLYKEVLDNLEKLKRFPADQATRDSYKQTIRANPNFRPLFVIQESTKFYDLSALTLPDIHSAALLALSGFYSLIAEEIAIARAFEGMAFPTISDDGRAGLIDDLWDACRNAQAQGHKALEQLERTYPRRWFRRFKP
jgi:hypothetical protein